MQGPCQIDKPLYIANLKILSLLQKIKVVNYEPI